jgi:hypothetical protein
MRKIICILLAAVLLLGLCACGGEGGAGGKKDGLQVGFGRESIVPDITGVEIAGGDASARLSDGYLDEVAATCIAITEGDQTILLYTIDFIVVDKNVYAAQPEIAEATGIPEENIILNTTHTHSGVSIRSKWDGVDAYRAKYRAAAVEAVRKLSADVGIPADLKQIVKDEDVQFLSESAYADACRPGNPRDTSVEEIAALYRKLL